MPFLRVMFAFIRRELETSASVRVRAKYTWTSADGRSHLDHGRFYVNTDHRCSMLVDLRAKLIIAIFRRDPPITRRFTSTEHCLELLRDTICLTELLASL